MDDKSKIKIIISLDGGGTRGYLTVHIIESLFKAAGVDIFEYAELFGGTSTGGIIAVAKAMGNLNNTKLGELYKSEEAINLFSKWDILSNIFNNSAATDPQKLENLITNALKDNLVPKKDHKNYFVVSLLKEVSNSENSAYIDQFKPVLITSYKHEVIEIDTQPNDEYYHPKYFEINESFNAVKALRCTSAIPFAFQSPTNEDGKPFFDGGIKYNNPVSFAYVEARKLFPKHTLLILSFGTGIPPTHKEEVEQINDINNKTTTKLERYLDEHREVKKWGIDMLTSMKDHLNSIISVAANAYELKKICNYNKTVEGQQQTGFKQFQDAVKIAENDPHDTFFYRFDCGLDTDIPFYETKKYQELENYGTKLLESSDFYKHAVAINNVLKYNGVEYSD